MTTVVHPTQAPTPQSSASGFQPLVRRLQNGWTAEYCFRRLANLDGCVWLDSSAHDNQLSRYSYMAVLPIAKLRVDKPATTSLGSLNQLCQKFFQPKVAGLPPMQGGWMGWFGYELGSCFETIPPAQNNDFYLPAAALGFYDVVLSWDHHLNEGWIVSQGWPAKDSKRQQHAYRRMKQILELLDAEQIAAPKRDEWTIPKTQLAKQFPTRWSKEWTSNFSAEAYREAVAKCVDYIHAGDIFQVNLSQRLLRQADCLSPDLYLRLRRDNPAPFSGYANTGRTVVISASPERFLQVQDGQVESRPIKGTRPRLSDPTADSAMGELLRMSAKDRSENVMIVDLLRNDLSRVAKHDSVAVPTLCGLEQYSHVWHLVSCIKASLLDDLQPSQLLAAAFPGGSITGAPKIRAMEIIAELEPTARGPYCGSLGYISSAGDMDLSILIRTITASQGWWQIPVGGGIVAESDPTLEEQETWHKAEGILRAIDSLKTPEG